MFNRSTANSETASQLNVVAKGEVAKESELRVICQSTQQCSFLSWHRELLHLLAQSRFAVDESIWQSDHSIFFFPKTDPARLLQTLVGRMVNIAGVVLLLKAFQDTHPDMAVPAEPFPVPQAF